MNSRAISTILRDAVTAVAHHANTTPHAVEGRRVTHPHAKLAIYLSVIGGAPDTAIAQYWRTTQKQVNTIFQRTITVLIASPHASAQTGQLVSSFIRLRRQRAAYAHPKHRHA